MIQLIVLRHSFVLQIVVCFIVVWLHILLYIYYDKIKFVFSNLKNHFKRENKTIIVIKTESPTLIIGETKSKYIEEYDKKAVKREKEKEKEKEEELPFKVEHLDLDDEDDPEEEMTEFVTKVIEPLPEDEREELNNAPSYTSSDVFPSGGATYEQLTSVAKVLQEKNVTLTDVPEIGRIIVEIEETDMFQFLVSQTKSEKLVDEIMELYLKDQNLLPNPSFDSSSYIE